jgi:hypothetical protein
MSESEPQYVAETLKWCNARRKEQGKKPLKKLPKGMPRDPESCPCGLATGLYVDANWWATKWVGPFDGRSELPLTVRRFVKAFDKRRLPQYEAAA